MLDTIEDITWASNNLTPELDKKEAENEELIEVFERKMKIRNRKGNLNFNTF